MTISDATRAQRVKGWINQKTRAQSKLEEASNPHDIHVGKAMVAEADSALERLDALEAQARDEKRNPVLKQKLIDKEKNSLKTTTKRKKDTGSLGI